MKYQRTITDVIETVEAIKARMFSGRDYYFHADKQGPGLIQTLVSDFEAQYTHKEGNTWEKKETKTEVIDAVPYSALSGPYYFLEGGERLSEGGFEEQGWEPVVPDIELEITGVTKIEDGKYVINYVKRVLGEQVTSTINNDHTFSFRPINSEQRELLDQRCTITNM